MRARAKVHRAREGRGRRLHLVPAPARGAGEEVHGEARGEEAGRALVAQGVPDQCQQAGGGGRHGRRGQPRRHRGPARGARGVAIDGGGVQDGLGDEGVEAGGAGRVFRPQRRQRRRGAQQRARRIRLPQLHQLQDNQFVQIGHQRGRQAQAGGGGEDGVPRARARGGRERRDGRHGVQVHARLRFQRGRGVGQARLLGPLQDDLHDAGS
jgi:hypothetical protein